MTKKIITSYVTFLCMAVVMTGATTVQASEVTGTLSSDSSTLNIEGTVTGGSGGGGSSRSGNSSEGSGGDLLNAPSGSVLGASADNTQTPGFPNAGISPEETPEHTSLWSTILNFLKNLVTF